MGRIRGDIEDFSSVLKEEIADCSSSIGHSLIDDEPYDDSFGGEFDDDITEPPSSPQGENEAEDEGLEPPTPTSVDSDGFCFKWCSTCGEVRVCVCVCRCVCVGVWVWVDRFRRI